MVETNLKFRKSNMKKRMSMYTCAKKGESFLCIFSTRDGGLKSPSLYYRKKNYKISK